ncbi:NF038120 family PEP-CTERM protein [Sphingosinicellaceae bacterium]|nr:NF038120 family PEP-CTERM protein [Sphingosinicellaceae bacterium]
MGICAVTAGTAQAVTIDFENVDTTGAPGLPFLSHGDVVTQDGYYFETINADGLGGYLDGTISNGSDPDACLMGVCPVGNLTNYLVGLNAGYFAFARLDGGKSTLSSFDAAFVTADGAPAMTVPALLLILAFHADGSVWENFYDLGAIGSHGTTAFQTYQVEGAGEAIGFLAVAYRCDDVGSCTRLSNEAQFAFDNVVLENVGPGATVPEPATWALMLLGFGGVGTVVRRQRNRLPLAA